MNLYGWIFMLVSVGSVTALTAWCFYRVLRAPAEPPEEVQHFRSA
jgi:hypothetical protein